MRTSCRKVWTDMEIEDDSTGGSPSTSVTTMGAIVAVSLWCSMRWNTTFTICVRLALAVVWFTSDLDSRKML